MNRILSRLIIILAALTLALSSCIEDGFSSSASDQPTFSLDTLQMGTIFTKDPSVTHRFTVYNRADKGISIDRISLSGEAAGCFRLNVDGFSGRDFSNVEIRAKDSIFVFVETTLPENGRNVPVEVCADIDFLTKGETRSVTLRAQGRDVTRLNAQVIDRDTRLTADKPYQIFDSLVVAPGATLTVDPGAELYFHDGAYMAVRGTLKAAGTADAKINMAGDRTGDVITGISFDIMSRQWEGLLFAATSTDNELSYADVRNTRQGVVVDEAPLLMVNSRLHNSGARVLEAYYADVRAYGCEFAEAAEGVVYLHGGRHVFNHCTFSNYYLFSAVTGPLLDLWHYDERSDDASGEPYMQADISNSIFYGLGGDLSKGDLTGSDIHLRRCLFKSEGKDDDNFINCIWAEDPLFYTVRQDYIFDYRLRDDSPVIGAADPSLTAPRAATDAYGLQRGPAPDLGAYVYTPQQ